jgi:putative nucleotidyltransferase with HDIG domain
MQSNQPQFIDISQLQVGMYVHLDLGWMDHPFTLSNFKVKDEAQISIIKKTGLKKVRYDPKRSDCAPLEIPAKKPTEMVSVETNKSIEATIEDKPTEVVSKNERLKELHHAINECEKKFINTSNIARQATRNILTDPKAAVEQAVLIVNDMVDTALMEGDVAVHALNGNRSSDANYVHPLNVTVLALLMAKSIEMSKEDARLLGLAALFHDIGKAEISDKILLKKEPLTKSEQTHYEQHSEIGARMAQEAGLPVRIGKIILQHHEHADGSGYPKHLRGEQTDQLARLVALVNGYDNLCNPNNFATAKTPYEALAHMYANQRTKYDESLLKRLIKSLGIYPPGSIVQLSTGSYATVISVNPNKPLRPFVMLHDPLSSRHEPQILDLREEPGINISACLRPNQLPLDVLDYLNPRKRISYFMDGDLSQSENEPT